MNDEQKYGYWDLNIEATYSKNGRMCFVCNCSACGHKVIDQWPNVCPNCHAIMVDPFDITDINDRDICAGDIVLCNIKGHKERVKGKIIHDTQWYLDNPVGFRWIYDCNNFEIVEGIIPKGKKLSKDFGKSISNRRR